AAAAITLSSLSPWLLPAFGAKEIYAGDAEFFVTGKIEPALRPNLETGRDDHANRCLHFAERHTREWNQLGSRLRRHPMVLPHRGLQGARIEGDELGVVFVLLQVAVKCPDAAGEVHSNLHALSDGAERHEFVSFDAGERDVLRDNRLAEHEAAAAEFT